MLNGNSLEDLLNVDDELGNINQYSTENDLIEAHDVIEANEEEYTESFPNDEHVMTVTLQFLNARELRSNRNECALIICFFLSYYVQHYK